jgi:HAD superfamily hydrolase (TIGR01549 family)
LDTSPLEPYRRIAQKSHSWKGVLQNLGRAKRFELGDSIRPDQLPAEFRKRGYKVAIVTSSIRPVAEGLLENFGIAHDALVAFHDTDDRKPHPAPFREALRLLGVAPADAYSIGDDWKDAQAAHHAGIVSIGVPWGVTDWMSFSGSASEVCFHEPSRVLELDEYLKSGYLGESIYHGDDKFVWHPGSVIWLGPNKTLGFCLGRYYSMSDPRHATSKLSNDIIAFKNNSANSEFFAPTFVAAFDHYKLLGDFRYVAAVPPKPGQSNRFAELLTKIGEQCNLEPLQDGLRCDKDYGGIKHLKPDERRAAVKGCFDSKYDWKNNDVILIDDVLTSAATTMECVATLKRKGAGNVLVAALGKDQSAFDHKFCPLCGRTMKIRNGRNGQFWGCVGYGDKQNQCRHTEDIPANSAVR